MYHQLKAQFDKIIYLEEEEEWNIIKDSFNPVKAEAGKILTSIGDAKNHIYFISTGVLRLFCHNPKGEEVTIFLYPVHHFASSYPSFVTRQPGNQALEAVTDCTLLSINKNQLEKLYIKVPKLNIITRIVADQRFINAQAVFTSQITLTPEERYRKFEKEHGNLLLKIPHHIIASFLGITPVSMSRIRKRLQEKSTIS